MHESVVVKLPSGIFLLFCGAYFDFTVKKTPSIQNHCIYYSDLPYNTINENFARHELILFYSYPVEFRRLI